MDASSNALRLLTWFSRLDDHGERSRCLVAFSGGVDSAVLAQAAKETLGDRTEAVFLRSDSLKHRALDGIRSVAEEIGIALTVLEGEEFADPRYLGNDLNRCYYCKKSRMRQLNDFARSHGFDLVVEGSNADDAGDFRPGARAVLEDGGRSPLAELGIGKSAIRELARFWHLSVHGKPSESCLSTRLEYGLSLTRERLERIDRAEHFLGTLGFDPVRVRMHADDHVRIEVAPERVGEVVRSAALIQAHLRELGFRLVSVDLEGYRTGKMNPVTPFEHDQAPHQD